MRKW
ncbi:Protein of unknown function [Bacillus mycoides]|jgi:hypothetical protein